jgi:DNA segregation ATPase FtsK/SpoIIIE, S-DNA-T family
MTNPDPDPDRFDWDRAEAELAADNEGDPEAAPVLVDSPEAQRPDRVTLAGLRAAERRPIIPAWARSAREAREMAAWALGFAVHILAYHLVRLPAYAGRLAVRSPNGLARTLGGWRRWLFDTEGEPLRRVSADRADAETYLKLARQRDRRVRWRAFLTCVLVVAFAAGAVLVAVTPGWARLGLCVVALGLLGRAGQPADRPLIQRAVVVPKAPRLTSDMVIAALGAIGNTAINQALAKKPDDAIEFVAPVARDGAHGYRADVNLPLGVTAGDVIERRDRLASGLRRALGCVWPEGVPKVHPGRLLLYVGDEDMATAKQPPWPLAKSGTVDLFRPFAFGTDQRCRPAQVTLMFASMVIGAIPRMGKTFALRLLALAAALDVLAELHLYDLKGTGDLGPLEPVAFRYRAGDDDDKGDIDYGLQGVRLLRGELRRRTERIRGLPSSQCPENKVTPELARLRHLRLHPIVLIVDECQRWFEHPKHGAEFKEICADLVKRGPAVGIIAIFATQRPDDGSLPAAIRDNAVLRFCLKVTDHKANNMVLGSGMYGAGIQATMFTRDDKGIGYLVGEADGPVIVRTYKVDQVAAERIVARARALREQAGTLAGHAIGENATETTGATAATTVLLRDILTVVPQDEAKVASDPLAAVLAEAWPDRYGELTKDQLNASLRALGIDTNVQVHRYDGGGERRNLRGITRQSVADALTQRDRQRGADQ